MYCNPSSTRVHQWAAGVIVAAAAALTISLGVLEPVERPLRDVLVRVAASHPPAAPSTMPDVAVVAIDPQSLREFPGWPWPRGLYARAVDRLQAAGARSIAFDIDLSTPRDPDEDARLADAMERSGRVVLAGFRQRQPVPGGGWIEIASIPTPAFSRAAAAIGSIAVPIDPDGVVRRAARSTELTGRPIGSLAAAAIRVALADPRTPDEPAAPIQLDYRRAAHPFPILPIADVIEGRFDPREVAGRIVLIGATAAEFQDLWTTPLGPAQPGVFVQVAAVRTLTAERARLQTLRPAPRAAELAGVVLLSLFAASLWSARHARRLWILGGLGASIALAAPLLVTMRGILFDPLIPLGVIAVHYAAGLEAVRSRFGKRLAERELSLTTLDRVGEIATGASGESGLNVSLGLLGDVVGASGIALLAVSDSGELGAGRIEWAPERGSRDRPVGQADIAARTLASGRLRCFEGSIPGNGGAGSAVYTPLAVGDQQVGVLVVERAGTTPLDDSQVRTIGIVGTQLALQAQNLRLLREVRDSFESSITAVATAVEAREGYTGTHCRRLAHFSSSIARRMGLDPAEVEAIRLGALLHDVGKIGIPDRVLIKPAELDPSERLEIEDHPVIGDRIVSGISGIAPSTVACVRHHHEWWDGSGYPDGLCGDQIPLAARIVAVIDVWDASSTPRPYKEAFDQDQVWALIEKGRGSQFDPAIVDLFREVFDNEGEEMLGLIDASLGRIS